MPESTPREWQLEFVDGLLDCIEEQKQTFLAVAPVGSGKTEATILACRELGSRFHDPVFVVVTPSDEIRRKWAKEMRPFGRVVSTAVVQGFPSDMRVLVFNYQSSLGMSGLLARLCRTRNVIVILDEIHHCSDDDTVEDTSWGAGIKAGLDGAAFRILLTATPWKTNGKALPWVTLDSDGYAIPDFVVSRSLAVDQGWVKRLGFMLIDQDGTIHTVRSSGRTSQDVRVSEAGWKAEMLARETLKTTFPEQALPEAERLLSAKEDRWLKKGAGPPAHPTCLVACRDTAQANRVHDWLCGMYGPDASVCVHTKTGENSSTIIDNFRERRGKAGKARYLVSVKQVFEGCDIKHLAVLVLLGPFRTTLYLDQVSGRIVRCYGWEQSADYHGTVIALDTPSNRKFAQTVMDLQPVPVEEEQPPWQPPPPPPPPPDEPTFTHAVLAGDAYLSTVNIQEQEVAIDVSLRTEINQIMASPYVPLDWKQKDMLSLILREAGVAREGKEEPNGAPYDETEEGERLRSSCSKMVKKLARLTGDPYSVVWSEAKREIRVSPAKSLEVFSLVELRSLYAYLKERLDAIGS